MLIPLILAALMLVFDQASKYWAVHVLKPLVDIPLWEGVFHFHYAENTGAAFSMLQEQSWVFYVFTMVAVGGMLYYLFRYRRGMHPLLRVALGLMMGGALGNFIDRVRLGYVVDFLYFRLINFAIFNIADSALVIGCVLMAVYVLFFHEKYMEKRKALKEGAAHGGTHSTDGGE
jgi:signal peptidase II